MALEGFEPPTPGLLQKGLSLVLFARTENLVFL